MNAKERADRVVAASMEITRVALKASPPNMAVAALVSALADAIAGLSTSREEAAEAVEVTAELLREHVPGRHERAKAIMAGHTGTVQ